MSFESQTVTGTHPCVTSYAVRANDSLPVTYSRLGRSNTTTGMLPNSSPNPPKSHQISGLTSNRQRMPLPLLCGKQLREHLLLGNGRPCNVTGENGTRLFRD